MAKRLGRSLLIGGNNASIVCADANLDLVVRCGFAATGTAGQRCTTLRRCMDDVYQTVVQRLTHAYQQLSVGDPLAPDVWMGPVIDQGAVDQYRQVLKDIQLQGGKILAGGQVIDRPGFFVAPCLVAASADWPLLKAENFVPILYVIRCNSLAEAIAYNNDSHHGLSSSIFTKTCSRWSGF